MCIDLELNTILIKEDFHIMKLFGPNREMVSTVLGFRSISFLDYAFLKTHSIFGVDQESLKSLNIQRNIHLDFVDHGE